MKKVCNIIYRILIFICCILSSIGAFILIDSSLKAADGHKTDLELISDFNSSMIIYQIVLAATVICLILGILGRHKCSGISVFFRSVFVSGVAILMTGGIKVVHSFSTLVHIMKKLNAVSLDHYDESLLGYYGYTTEQIDAYADNLDNEVGMILMIVGMICAAIVYFILTLTSVHNLVKSEKPAFNPYYQQNMFQNGQYMPNGYQQNGQFYGQDQQSVPYPQDSVFNGEYYSNDQNDQNYNGY